MLNDAPSARGRNEVARFWQTRRAALPLLVKDRAKPPISALSAHMQRAPRTERPKRMFQRPRAMREAKSEADVSYRAVTEAGAAAAGEVTNAAKYSQLRRFVFRFLSGLDHIQFLSCCTPVAGLIPIKCFPYYKNAALA